jgi:tetratricopeptide (TPR) repeat protein
VTAYEEALELLAQASAHAEANAEVAEERARAHGLIAQAVDFEVKDLQARTGPEGVPTSLRTKRSRHVDKALERAKRAVDLAPESFKAHLALADALRLADRPDESERELEQAAALLNEADARRRAELSYVRGLSAMTRAGGDAAQAQTHAQAAVDEDPDLLRARLLLARAKLASGDVSQARAQLRAVLDREPAHPHAETLQDALDQGIAPAPAVLAVLDGGARDAGAIEAGTSEDRGTLARAASDGDRRQRDDPPQDETSDGVPAGRDADYYLRRGEELQTRGKLGQARAFCERALERSPGHPEALVCLGYVALDTGRLAEALSHFRAASTRDYAEAYIGLGTVYRRQGRPRKALDAYESYLSKFPAGQQRSIAERQASRLREQVDGPGPSEEPMPPEGQATPEEQAPAPREGAEPVAPQTDPLAIESDPETP